MKTPPPFWSSLPRLVSFAIAVAGCANSPEPRIEAPSPATAPARAVIPEQPTAPTQPSRPAVTVRDAQTVASTTGPVSKADAIAFEQLVLHVLSQRDFPALARLVHPTKGLTMTNGLMTLSVNNVTLTEDEVRSGAADRAVRAWGISMAGDSVHETTAQHFTSIFGTYEGEPLVNHSTDGTHEADIVREYPAATFVDINDTTRRNGPVVFNTVLVMERLGDKLFLVGIVADR